MTSLFGGLSNPTAIIEAFTNEARKILNEIANKQADELVQGIIREKVTKNMDTIFNSGYVQQAAASAFNSTIYPEYIRRLKNLEAFLKLSADQDNGLKEQLASIPDADRTPDKIIEIINAWANAQKPTLEEIQSKIKGPPNTEFNTTGDIGAILDADKAKESEYTTKIAEADTNNVEVSNAQPPVPAQPPVINGLFKSLFNKQSNQPSNQLGGKKTKRRRIRRQRKSYRTN